MIQNSTIVFGIFLKIFKIEINTKMQIFNKQNTINAIKSTYIFSSLSNEDLSKIAEIGKIKFFAKNEPIVKEGESGNSMFIISSGKVKVVRIDEQDNEVIFSLLYKGDAFGELSLIDGLSRSASCIAMEDTSVFILLRDNFLNIIQNNYNFTIDLLSSLSQKLRKADFIIKNLSTKSAEKKVHNMLCMFIEDIGIVYQKKIRLNDLPMFGDIANMAGIARETFSRVLHQMEKDGLISIIGRTITIENYDKFINETKL